MPEKKNVAKLTNRLEIPPCNMSSPEIIKKMIDNNGKLSIPTNSRCGNANSETFPSINMDSIDDRPRLYAIGTPRNINMSTPPIRAKDASVIVDTPPLHQPEDSSISPY
jgi:hypothetical protein